MKESQKLWNKSTWEIINKARKKSSKKLEKKFCWKEQELIKKVCHKISETSCRNERKT